MAGTQGFISLGIPAHSSLAEVWLTHRRRRHRRDDFNSIEQAIWEAKERGSNREDHALWCGKNGTFKPNFSSKHTWNNIRNPASRKVWSTMVWFKNATPRCAFITWLAMLNRLSTGECMAQWGQGLATSCIFKSDMAKVNAGTAQVHYTYRWNEIILLFTSNALPQTELFLARYTLLDGPYFDLEGAKRQVPWRHPNSS
ncbi:uncharacterized protein LOC112083481 [Eutrema salsugineum]|uniref:uncharacterized protein LOC112083481 n=1 Tax=Eutrema salsugineum TaxID=72664 RepID=UPI000CED63E4|nr:uncharacterized protein LOC112083481 [Eutrema salsugineum]